MDSLVAQGPPIARHTPQAPPPFMQATQDSRDAGRNSDATSWQTEFQPAYRALLRHHINNFLRVYFPILICGNTRI